MELPVCKCCKDWRLNHDQQPRLMAAVVIHYQERPYLFCPFCDGDAFQRALENESSYLTP